jgi:hypothetical protein
MERLHKGTYRTRKGTRRAKLNARARRRVELSHNVLTEMGIPRHADGNRLGLRKRTQMAEKSGVIRRAN